MECVIRYSDGKWHVYVIGESLSRFSEVKYAVARARAIGLGFRVKFVQGPNQ